MSKYNFPKVVVTGMGAVTPIGNTVQELWQSLMEGKSGAAPITQFDTEFFKTKFACEVKDFDATKYLDRKEAQRMDLFTHFAMASAIMAIEDSGLDLEKLDGNRAGVIVGSGIGGMWTYHQQVQNMTKRDGKPDRISPFFIPMMIGNIASGHIAIRFGFGGPCYSTLSACATSSHSIADAVMQIQRGNADVMIAGGSEAAICPMGVGGFNSMQALSTRNDDPQSASRPFDKDRDGFVMGEGGGILVLETEEHALARGAKIYCEISGFGMTDDAYHITAPCEDGDGAARSMKLAIEDSGLKTEDIDYINVHGTSTPLGDIAETKAIKKVFGEHAYKLSISSTKSMTGHLLGAAGAVEAIATILAMKYGKIPPTINYHTPDPDCDLDCTPNVPKEKAVKAALSNTFGFGGHNATLCFKAYK
ncbi:MAG: beta-ketoacyl-ACP synthase II [bacterium]